MRLVVRSLVLLTFPVIAFGWLATARILPDRDDWTPAFTVDPAASAILFLLSGAVLVVGGGIYLMLTDFFGSPSTVSRPLMLPAVVIVALATVTVLSLWGRDLGDEAWAIVAMLIAGTIAVGFVALLGAVTLVRAVIGLWSRPELPIWPGRRAVTLLLLLAAIAATPVQTGHDSVDDWFSEPVLVPLAEKVRMDLFGDPTRPVWRY